MKRFAFVLAIITIMFAVTFNVSAPLVLAEEKGETVQFIERDLAEKNTDVVSVLKGQKRDYQARLSIEEDEETRLRLQTLIDDTQKLLDDYVGESAKTRLASVRSTAANQDVEWMFYENSVSACVAYFYANEYYLSAELLTHARYNRVLNSLYSPINIEVLENSSAFITACGGNDAYGWGEFAKAGDVADMDLFYAIHNFRYAKFQEGEVITLHDNYNFVFDGGYDFIDDVPIKVMYMAQEKGVIVPFHTVIETRLSGTGEGRENETYPRISYANGEYHIYQSPCSNDCFALHNDAHRDVAAAHTDENADGMCDGCGAIVGELTQPKEEEQTSLFSKAVDGIKGAYRTVKSGFVDLLDSVGIGCSNSLGGSLSVLSSLTVGGLLFRKKKKN